MRQHAMPLLALLGLLGVATPVVGVVVPAPGWVVRTIPTPEPVQGGVARADDVILVGQGATFSAGAQSIVRLTEGGPAVPVATGFNSLGAVVLDGGGTLWATDNGLEAPGTVAATTGDTVYGIPDALTRTTPLAAGDAELLPAGSIPGAADVLPVPGGTLLVSDAAGVGLGRIVRIEGSAASDLVTGLDFVGGLALAPDGTLRVANLDGSFLGTVLRFELDGAPLGALAAGLSGSFDTVVEPGGETLVSGGFTEDFASSTIVAVAADGSRSERARGFAFSGAMFHDAVRDELLVLDAGASAITALCRDADADGACDADDACVGDGPVGDVTLRLGRLTRPAGRHRLVFRGTLTGLATPDPRATGVRIALADGAATRLDAVVPGGAGWRRRGRTWRWRDPAGAIAGITKVLVRTRRSGAVRFGVVAQRGTLSIDPAALPLRASFALDARAGACGTTALAATGCDVRKAGKAVRCR